MKKYLTYNDIDRIERFVRTKQWWDTVDSLIKPIGDLGLRDARINELMLEWSTDSDFWVDGVKVVGKVLAQDKAKKVVVYKYKPKKDYRKKQGHRQPYTRVLITSIG